MFKGFKIFRWGFNPFALCLFSFNLFEPVWKGEKPNQTEPKLIGLNRFSVRFGSKTKKNKIGLVVYFGPKPDRTENAQP